MAVMEMEELRLERALQRMTEIVEDDRWCRDRTTHNQNHAGTVRASHCALGLISKVQCEGLLGNDYSYEGGIYDLLVAAIPAEAMEELSGLKYGMKRNGGTSRGIDAQTSIIATFNNTRPGPGDIVAWLDRATRLLKTGKWKENAEV